MKIRYDKMEVRKITWSGILLLCFLAAIMFLCIKDKNYACIICIFPVLAVIMYRIFHLLFHLLPAVRRNKVFLKLTQDKLWYQPEYGKNIEISLNKIEQIQIDSSGIEVYTEEFKKPRRLFSYYVPGNSHICKIPVWGKYELMKHLAEEIKQKTNCRERKDDILEATNLCCSYFCILAGILWCFAAEIYISDGLQSSLIHFCVTLVGIGVIHLTDKKHLASNGLSVGRIIRCFGCSLAIAQYMVCACRVEEVLKNTDFNLSVSSMFLGGVFLIFLCICSMFLPKNAWGKRFVMRNLRSGRKKINAFG